MNTNWLDKVVTINPQDTVIKKFLEGNIEERENLMEAIVLYIEKIGGNNSTNSYLQTDLAKALLSLLTISEKLWIDAVTNFYSFIQADVGHLPTFILEHFQKNVSEILDTSLALENEELIKDLEKAKKLITILRQQLQDVNMDLHQANLSLKSRTPDKWRNKTTISPNVKTIDPSQTESQNTQELEQKIQQLHQTGSQRIIEQNQLLDEEYKKNDQLRQDNTLLISRNQQLQGFVEQLNDFATKLDQELQDQSTRHTEKLKRIELKNQQLTEKNQQLVQESQQLHKLLNKIKGLQNHPNIQAEINEILNNTSSIWSHFDTSA